MQTPLSQRASLERAYAAIQAAAFEKAIELLEFDVKLHPSDATAQGLLSQALLGLGRVEPALTHARQAVQLARTEPLALCALGTALEHAGRPQEALLFLSEAVQLDPANLPARAARAAALLAMGRSREALAESLRALELDPTNTLAIHVRVRSLRTLGRAGEADRSVRVNVKVKRSPAQEKPRRAGHSPRPGA